MDDGCTDRGGHLRRAVGGWIVAVAGVSVATSAAASDSPARALARRTRVFDVESSPDAGGSASTEGSEACDRVTDWCWEQMQMRCFAGRR